MKKAVLLGDSIRQIGYGLKVPEVLAPEYEVFQPEENCRFAKYTLRMVMDLQETLKDADVIHWNNGLWDVCLHCVDDGVFTEVDEYVENMVRIGTMLKKFTPNVIFATTTPCLPDSLRFRNEDIDRYNAAVVPRLEALGIVINDLHTLVADHAAEFIRDDDKVHLTQAGIDACAEQVARAIRQFD